MSGKHSDGRYAVWGSDKQFPEARPLPTPRQSRQREARHGRPGEEWYLQKPGRPSQFNEFPSYDHDFRACHDQHGDSHKASAKFADA